MNSLKLAPLLLVFVEVAKLGSITAAAKRLGLSKSAVSQQIARLEDALEQQLLVRNTRSMVLTRVGEVLLNRCELLNEQLHLTLDELENQKEQPSGEFRVSVPPFLEKEIVVPALAQLQLEFPKLKPELIVTGKWQDLVEHNLDVAIFGGDLKDCDYRAVSIGRVAEVFCASPRYIKQKGKIEDVRQLAEDHYIASPWQSTQLQLFDVASGAKVPFLVEYKMKTNTLSTLAEMIVSDMGIGLLPEFYAKPFLAKQQMIQVLSHVKGRAWHFYLIHQFKGEKPPHIARFHQLIRHYLDKLNGSR